MTTTYPIHVNELSADIVKSIQLLLKAKTVEVTVSNILDETDYLLGNEANRKSL